MTGIGCVGGVGEREVTAEEFVSAVDQDGIHSNIDEWSTVPNGEDINEQVADSKHKIACATHNKDEGWRPQVLVDRDPSVVLASLAENGSDDSPEETPEHPSGNSVLDALVILNNSSSLHSDEAQEDGGDITQSSFRIIRSSLVD